MNTLSKLTKAELIKLLETERANHTASELLASEKLASADEMANAFKQADAGNAQEIIDLTVKLEAAKTALQPFHGKCQWGDTWPNENVAVIQKLTFGDLKRAQQAYLGSL